MLDCDYCDCDKNVMKLKRNYQVLDYTQFSLSLERSAKEPHRAVWEAQVPFSKSHLYMAIISRTDRMTPHGAVHILRQPPEGGGGVSQKLTIAGKGGCSPVWV